MVYWYRLKKGFEFIVGYLIGCYICGIFVIEVIRLNKKLTIIYCFLVFLYCVKCFCIYYISLLLF